MSTYAQVSDFTSYTTLTVNTPSNRLQGLLDCAENDVDKILPRTPYLTGLIMGITLNGVTNGNFELALDWRGITYTSPAIQWNALGSDVLAALQAMTDASGNLIPPGAWDIPDARYYQQTWAYGPLSASPVVIQAVNSLGRQALTLPAVVNNLLAGPNPQITVQQIVGGGLRVNPYQIPADYADTLKSAVCAQAEYRDQMGESFFARAQYRSVQGPEFRTQGKLPLIGPKVMRELSGTDIVQRGARARPGTATGRTIVYSPVGGTPIPDDWRAI